MTEYEKKISTSLPITRNQIEPSALTTMTVTINLEQVSPKYTKVELCAVPQLNYTHAGFVTHAAFLTSITPSHSFIVTGIAVGRLIAPSTSLLRLSHGCRIISPEIVEVTGLKLAVGI